MPPYLSPGVYVEEVPSAVKAIAGVSTSTAGFIGIVPDELVIPVELVTDRTIGTGNEVLKDFNLPKDHYPVLTTTGSFQIRVKGEPASEAKLNLNDTAPATVTFSTAPASGVRISADYLVISNLPRVVEAVTDQTIGTGNGEQKDFNLPVAHYPVQTTAGSFQIKVNGNPDNNARLNLNDTAPAKVTFTTPPGEGAQISADYLVIRNLTPVTAGEVKLCTNFSEYKTFFGDFSTDPGHRYLTHAVFGFFNNGGSRCYVARVKAVTDIQAVLTQFEAIDEIAIVAAPGITEDAVRSAIDTHCRQTTQDRFAIFDSPEVVETKLLNPSNEANILPDNSDFAAFYFPWIQVFDPATKIQNPDGDGLVFVPPSGHIAGIYARVDTQRGVHKAPANEPILGALGLKYRISKAQQDGLNPQGVNCIRDLNGNIRVWGARTLGGDANQDLKYINVRRTLLFLRESIDEGMQFVVFEPNTPALWQKIVRNVSDFLTNVWRSGALFGTTPQQAFFVRCDAELNTSQERELGRVITEIGVALVRPAEFVIFRLSQFTAPGS